MKTKEEIIQALRGSKIVMINTGNPRNAEYIQHAINYIESMPKIHEELSTLNPMKIDEERFYKIWNKKDISEIEDILSEYNSTCKDHQVLQPLPSDEDIEKEANYRFTTGHGATDHYSVDVFINACKWLNEKHINSIAARDTRIKELEERPTISSNDIMIELFAMAGMKNEDGMKVIEYLDKENGGSIAYLRHDAVVKTINKLTPPKP